MTLFTVFWLWLGACWLVYQLKTQPLQPDQPCDELADVDMDERGRQVDLRERAWLDRPVLNVRLSQRWVKRC